jgi:hypothetical protein
MRGSRCPPSVDRRSLPALLNDAERTPSMATDVSNSESMHHAHPSLSAQASWDVTSATVRILRLLAWCILRLTNDMHALLRQIAATIPTRLTSPGENPPTTQSGLLRALCGASPRQASPATGILGQTHRHRLNLRP